MSSPGVNPIALALEAIECSNRCRHCETSYGPRTRHLSRDEIRIWTDGIRGEAERLGVNITLRLNNSELLDHPDWRMILADFGREKLGRAFATNGRRIAREPQLVEELKERGVEWLQLTLGGGSAETHDAFTQRSGSFADIIAAASLAHAAGVHVVWNYIAYRPLAEIARMYDLAKSISGPYAEAKFDDRGGIDQGIYLVKLQGGGVNMEHLRPTCADLTELPEWASTERFGSWYGAACETESDLVNALRRTERCIGCLEQGHPECGGSGLVACRNGDVHPYCHERHPSHLLGNLNTDGLGGVLERFFADPPPALAIRRRGLAELAAIYGDPNGDRLHSGCSLCRTLVNRALREDGS